MKYLTLVFLLFCTAAYPKKKRHKIRVDFELVRDNQFRTDPRLSEDLPLLVEKLIAPYQTNEEKLAALFVWVCDNITYSTIVENGDRSKETRRSALQHVKKYRNGVCVHFTVLFNEMCRLINLEAHYVSGYVGHSEYEESGAHAWSIVKVDGNWYGFDVTWAAGTVMDTYFVRKFNPYYFMLQPHEFIQHHMPFDKIWQMLEHPFTYDDFRSADFKVERPYFNFEDAMHLYEQQSYCESLPELIKRIETNGLPCHTVVKRLMSLYSSLKRCNR